MKIPSEAVLELPGSKSHANRAIVAACLARGRTVIKGATPCDDVSVMVENVKKLGFNIRWIDKESGELAVDGGIPSEGGKAMLDCHNAGTTMRFLASVASVVPGEWTLTGDEHMRSRPIGDLTAALRSLGVEIEDTNRCPPIHIRGGTISGERVRLRADLSSQYLTSLLLVGPTFDSGLTIEITGALTSPGYIDLTQKVMNDFGIELKKESNTFFVHNGCYAPQDSYRIEGDWSAAGAWLVLNALTGSTVMMPNLRDDSDQSDRAVPALLATMASPGHQTIDCTDVPDQTMNLAVFAAFRKGTTVFTGIKNLRKKECDRIRVTATEFRKAGIDISEKGDDLVVKGFGSLDRIASTAKAVTLDPHDDHRMAMCFAILGLIRGNITIKNPQCVQKSYPHFFSDLEAVIRHSKPLSIVGMRGVGKSALGRKLAAKLGLTFRDSDHLFTDVHGPIREFIAAKGWDEFRKKEEQIIAQALKPGIVLSLGGGALGSKATRNLMKQKTIPLWLQAKESELVKRLGNAKRPRLTDLPIHEEVRKFLIERGPHYREVAVMEISPTLKFSEQVPFVSSNLRRLFLGLKPKIQR